MRKLGLLLLFAICGVVGHAQPYFPPNTGDVWATEDPSVLGWCQEGIDSLHDLLEANHTKAFIVLHEGRIVLEQYFGTFTQDSLWYWASAGKTLVSTTIGIAQEAGYLDIHDATSDHLGIGWTSCPPEKEALITVRDQLTMTTGLDDLVPDPTCIDPSCLVYEADAGTRWAYHNGPYTLLHDVVAEATGQFFSLYFNVHLRDPIGMDGLWIPIENDRVYFSKARSMARFGLLALNNMIWDGDTILHDQAYFTSATTPSQELNESYGYLWWLNGQESFMLPQVQFVFDGELMPHAPADLYAALGKNDQLLNISPSRKLVVVRMGDAAYESQAVAVVFNDEIWEHIENLDCGSANVHAAEATEGMTLSPTPCSDVLHIHIQGMVGPLLITVLDVMGRPVISTSASGSIDVSRLAPGTYTLTTLAADRRHIARFVKR